MTRLGIFISNLLNPQVTCEKQENNVKYIPAEVKIGEGTSLMKAFEHEWLYVKIMNILVNEKMISEVKNIWIDHGSGYKSTIVKVIKDLHNKGYMKNNSKLTNQQIREVSLDTFSVDIGIDTIKHVKYKDAYLKYIPPVDKMFLN